MLKNLKDPAFIAILAMTGFIGAVPIAAIVEQTQPLRCHVENQVSIQGWLVEYRMCDGRYGLTHTETPLRNLDTGTEYAK